MARLRSYILFAFVSSILGASLTAAQIVGTCDPALGEAYLDVNNVRARIPNNGSLFYRSEPHVYTVPVYSGLNTIFAGNIWIASYEDDKWRGAGTRYGPYEFWAGPLDDLGRAPVNCADYDRVYKVSRTDIELYESAGQAKKDLEDWPTGLGAPTQDAQGRAIDLVHLPFESRKERLINLSAGERPIISGDQMIWWVMNDRGNNHHAFAADPIGVEVQVSTFAASTSTESVNNATFYRYRIVNKNSLPLKDAYFGLFLDADLGDDGDDYIGSDSLLNLAYVYNADDVDGGEYGYGTPPPALGVQIIQGPSGDNDGIDNDRDGLVDEPAERAGLSYFMFYTSNPCVNCEGIWEGNFDYLRGRWPYGNRLTYGGDGRDPSSRPTNYMYPGDPTTGEYWSEMNTDSLGTKNRASDRRFVMSSGPFTLAPGESTDVVFSIVWAIGSDHLDSVRKMKLAAEEVRAAFKAGLVDLPAGTAPTETVTLIAPSNAAKNQSLETTLHWEPISSETGFEVEVISTDSTRRSTVFKPSLQLDDLTSEKIYGWRVRAVDSFGSGPWTDLRWFETGESSFQSPVVFSKLITVQNAVGPLEPPDMAAFAFNESGFPTTLCRIENPEVPCRSPTEGYQQATNDSAWGIHAGGAETYYDPLADSLSFVARITRNAQNLDAIGSDDYEIRFTPFSNKAIRLFEDRAILYIPFELWNIGHDSPDDPSDDVRLIPALCEEACGAGTTNGVFDIGGDHRVSGSSNDPFSDWIYWYEPSDMTAGESGYLDYFAGSGTLGTEVFANMVLVQWNGGSESPYDVALPEVGTIFRLVTSEKVAPVLSAPSDKGQVSPGFIPFYWDGLSSDEFRLQLSVWHDFTQTLTDTTGVTSGYSLPIADEGSYFWRIAGMWSGWSETKQFRVSSAPLGDDRTGIPVPIILYDNYPNPVEHSTTIEYFVPAATHVRLQIFDLLGRRVAMLIDREVGPGRHVVPYEVRDLANGVYFYSLQTSGSPVVSKMVVLR